MQTFTFSLLFLLAIVHDVASRQPGELFDAFEQFLGR